MTSREEIAAAVSTVDGLEIYPYYEQVSTEGQGYVEWLRTEYPNRLGGEDYWGVVIILPADLRAAQEWIEANRAAVVAALVKSKVLVVTDASPAMITLPDNPGTRTLVIEGHRESEE